MATIHNDSEETTIANDFKLDVTTPDGKKHSAVFMRLGKEKELRWTSTSGVTTVIPGTDALEEKTYNHEILKGGSVMGQVLFLLLGVSHDSVIDPSTQLTFSAKDNKGYVYEDTESIAEISRK